MLTTWDLRDFVLQRFGGRKNEFRGRKSAKRHLRIALKLVNVLFRHVDICRIYKNIDSDTDTRIQNSKIWRKLENGCQIPRHIRPKNSNFDENQKLQNSYKNENFVIKICFFGPKKIKSLNLHVVTDVNYINLPKERFFLFVVNYTYPYLYIHSVRSFAWMIYA